MTHPFRMFPFQEIPTNLFVFHKGTANEWKQFRQQLAAVDASSDTVRHWRCQAEAVKTVEFRRSLAEEILHWLKKADELCAVFVEVDGIESLTGPEYTRSELVAAVEGDLQQQATETALSRLNGYVRQHIRRIRSIREARRTLMEQTPQTSTLSEPLIPSFRFQSSSVPLLALYKQAFHEEGRLLCPELYLDIRPPFQRELVWSEEKKQAFIVSLLRQVPIGAFYENETERGHAPLLPHSRRILWDGQQRLHALHDFLTNQLAIPYQGRFFTFADHATLFYMTLADCIVPVYTSRFQTLSELVDAYLAINRHQFLHTESDLERARLFLTSLSS